MPRECVPSTISFIGLNLGEKPDELIHDLALLRNLEAEIEHGTTRADNEIQDDDLNECVSRSHLCATRIVCRLAACLREYASL